ncbi:carbohydrate sulfotransferase 15-like [Haliotis rufescens]|uniref:carbohydrate sulfotransferase 15-like n=1 Tax=Haliotis rufescens TaxID=6454 RepID=UPI00201F617D|nr:carbohydrate sulfotransferase 15-like [Haliotis rufescens]
MRVVAFATVVLVCTFTYMEFDQVGQNTPWQLIWNTDRLFKKEVYMPQFPCVGAIPGEDEDLFCLNRTELLPDFKNPCWKDQNGTISCLPYFHLIGSDKCGSTDLFNRITHHPDVETCSCVLGKEATYWSWFRYGIVHKSMRRHHLTFADYINMFRKASVSIKAYAVDDYHPKVVGDGTPMDFWDFRGWTRIPQNRGLQEPLVLTPHLMRHVYKYMKFLLIFRNPIDRLYSDYYFMNYGRSPESFHDHVILSVWMMKKCIRENSVRTCMFSTKMYHHLPTRLHIGCYSVFLKEWLSVFPREDFLILRTEDYKANAWGTLSDVFKFLSLPPLNVTAMDNLAQLKKQHETKSKRNALDMKNSTRRILHDFYAEYNKELADILNDDKFLWET